MKREKFYIAHVCLNSQLNPKHKDYCFNGFIDIAPSKNSNSLQCVKLCESCKQKLNTKSKQK